MRTPSNVFQKYLIPFEPWSPKDLSDHFLKFCLKCEKHALLHLKCHNIHCSWDNSFQCISVHEKRAENEKSFSFHYLEHFIMLTLDVRKKNNKLTAITSLSPGTPNSSLWMWCSLHLSWNGTDTITSIQQYVCSCPLAMLQYVNIRYLNRYTLLQLSL